MAMHLVREKMATYRRIGVTSREWNQATLTIDFDDAL